jgi:5-methylcytosine-specific restriction endonuclease McrA
MKKILPLLPLSLLLVVGCAASPETAFEAPVDDDEDVAGYDEESLDLDEGDLSIESDDEATSGTIKIKGSKKLRDCKPSPDGNRCGDLVTMNVPSPAELGLGKKIDAKCLRYLCEKFKKLEAASNKGKVKFVKQKEYGGTDPDPTDMRVCINGRNVNRTSEWRKKNGSKAETTDHKHDLDLGGKDAAANYAGISSRCNGVASDLKIAALRAVVKADGTTANANGAKCLGTTARVRRSAAFLAACN